MKIHEYQAKGILRRYKVPVPQGEVAFSAEDARQVAEKLGGRVVVKAQIHAGGRGKGGGIKIAENADEAEKLASRIIGMTLVTYQTGPRGRLVKRVLVEETLPIDRELYLGIVLDRKLERPVLMASSAGGMEIEEVAAKTPELILKEVIDPGVGLMPYQARRLAFGMDVTGPAFHGVVEAMTALAETYQATDAGLVEINPFVITSDGRAIALDAKMDFDDNGLFRHDDLAELRDVDEEDPLETDAAHHGLNYIKLDGSVGCMVNGAGLAMGTMDIIQYAGGSPANFLDVGGGANADQIKNGLRIILADSNVRAILVNVFGGILRVDVLAEGVVSATKELEIKVPIVLRLEGTKVEEGRRILEESGLDFTVAADMKEAAQKVVALAGS